ncbi:MAG: AMP-binding protein [Gammaproteobacteria bacterium]
MDAALPSLTTWIAEVNTLLKTQSAEKTWEKISHNKAFLREPFAVHQSIFNLIYPNWHQDPESAPAWIPSSDVVKTANLTQFMATLGFTDLSLFRLWAREHYQDFWAKVAATLPIKFKKPAEQTVTFSNNEETPTWFPNATLNIADSCFTTTPTQTAITYLDQQQRIQHLTYQALDELSNQVANGLVALGYQPGDAIGMAIPMNKEAVAIYLGIIKMGGVIVSVPDSFSSQEMLTRFNIAKTKLIFTQDSTRWGGKEQPLYQKVKELDIKAVVLTLNQPTVVSAELLSSPRKRGSMLAFTDLSREEGGNSGMDPRLRGDDSVSARTTDQPTNELRVDDLSWPQFLSPQTQFDSVACDPMSACHILFSSGTTGEPKAIIWNHTTPIKAASDAYFHQNIKPGDVLAWPTSLGWMMGPWLVFAALINHASLALYTEAPKDKVFGTFIQEAGVTMLGVVPTLVAVWRQTDCMHGLDWHHIKIFSSTGECSNPDDMLYLMSLAGYPPIIEYCGGTEIGGAYLSSTVIEKNYPSLFTAPTMGLDITILDETGKPSRTGEVAIIPPSIGLSTTLLNADHHHIYFDNMPTTESGIKLRRHGDQIKQLAGGHFSILGRADDTMNLGGIKISAAEIERSLANTDDVLEVAAIAISPPDNGPSLLVIFAATTKPLDKANLLKIMQKNINNSLSPLFKIYDVVLTTNLPKTASNKIMRRTLRNQYKI